MKHTEENIQSLLMKVSHRYFAMIFAQAAKLGLHPGQLPVLKILHDKDGISQTEIAEKLCNRPSSVTVSLKRMEKMGLVRRETDEKDQRVMRVYLTQKARDMIKIIPGTLEKNEKILLEGLNDTEICLLRRMLCQMLDNVRNLQKLEFQEFVKEDTQV